MKTSPAHSTCILRKVWRRLRHMARQMLVQYTDLQGNSWARRGEDEARKYWERRADKGNQYLLCALSQLEFRTVLEIGSNSGPRLFAIASKWPHVEARGIDINSRAVAFGNRRFRELSMTNVRLFPGRIEKLSMFEDDSFDLCLSWASLIYIKPRDIAQVLRNILRIARKAVVLIEMNSDSLKSSQKAGVLCGGSNWLRHYGALFRDLGVGESQISIREVPLDVWAPGGGGGSCIVVRK